MTFTIRPATPADAPALARLRYDFRIALAKAGAEPEAAFLERCGAWMAERLSKGRWRCWVAERNQAIIGQVWVQLIEKIPNPAPEREFHAYVSNMFVRPEDRGGIGSALLAEALDWCREQQVDSVILWPTPRSRSLYTRRGFAVRDAVMELKLA